VKSTVNDQDLEFLAGLTEPQRRCALMLTLVTNGDVTEAARAARELDPRDQVESRLRPPIKTSRSPAQTPDEPGFWDLTIEVLLGGLSPGPRHEIRWLNLDELTG